MILTVQDNLSHRGLYSNVKLSLWQRFVLRLNGTVFVRWEKRRGWLSHLPLYVVKCDKHWFFLDYPHGYDEHFNCPECRKELGVTKKEEVKA